MSELLKNKLAQFDATPPKGVWDEIAIELDNISAYKHTSERLFNYEATPPGGTFEKITFTLDNDLPQKQTPVKKITTFLKWSVAAAVLLAVATTGLLLFNKKSAPQIAALPMTDTNNNLPSLQSPGLALNNTEDDLPATTEAEENLKPQLKQLVAKNSHSEQLYSGNRNIHPAEPAEVGLITTKAKVHIDPPRIKESLAELAAKFVLNGNYITISGPNGETKKISLKLFNAVYGHNFLNNSDADPNTLVESAVWEKKLSEWRNKIVQSGFVPNAGNGMDILNLKELIREN